MAWEHTTEDNLYRCVNLEDNLPETPMNTNIINCSGLQAHKLSATHLLASPDENRNPLNDSTGTFLFFYIFTSISTPLWAKTFTSHLIMHKFSMPFRFISLFVSFFVRIVVVVVAVALFLPCAHLSHESVTANTHAHLHICPIFSMKFNSFLVMKIQFTFLTRWHARLVRVNMITAYTRTNVKYVPTTYIKNVDDSFRWFLKLILRPHVLLFICEIFSRKEL